MNEERVAKLKSFVEADPSDSFSKYALAMEYASGGKEADAVRQLQELLAADSRYIPAFHQLGLLFQKLGQFTKARATLEIGIAEAVRQSDTHAADEMREVLEEMEESGR